MLVGSALCAAAFVGKEADSGARTRALDPAALLPAGTVVMISIDGGPCTQFAKELAIAKIANEPDVKNFAKSAFEWMNESVGEGKKSFAKSLGTTPEELDKLVQSRIVLGVTKFAMPEGEEKPDVDLMLAMELRGNQKTVEALLKLAEGQMSAMSGGEEVVKDATVAGVPGRVMSVPPVGPFESLTYVINDGWLLAATNVKDLEAAITRAKSGDPAGSLLADARYAAGAKDVMRPKTIMSFFADYGAMLEMMAKTSPEVKTMMATSGIDTMKGVMYAMELDGPSIRERFSGNFAPNTPLLKPLVPTDLTGILARVPKRAIGAYAMSFDLRAYYEQTMKSLAGIPDLQTEVQQGMEEVDKVLGPSWREDLLPNLGPEMAVFAAMPQYGLMPDIGVILKVGDRAKVEAAIARALDRPKAKAAHRTITFGDASIHYMDLGTMQIDKDMNLRPAYTFVDGHLLITLCPVSAKNLLAGMAAKDGGLMSREDFSTIFGRMKAENPAAGNAGVGYLDTQWIAGFALGNLLPIAQCAVSPDDLENIPVKIDLGELPTAHAIVKHLTGTVIQTTVKENQVYSEMVSPTGVMPLFVGIGGVAGYLSVMRLSGGFPEPDMEPPTPIDDKDPPKDEEPKDD